MNASHRDRRGGFLRRKAVAESARVPRPPSGFDPLAESAPPDEAFEATWRAQFKRRVLIVIVALGCWTAAIEARLIELQVVQHQDLLGRAERQQQNHIKLPAKRGDIVDRHGQMLAYSVDADSIFATPHEVKDPAGTAAALRDALTSCSDADRAQLLDRLKRKSDFVYLCRWAAPEDAARVRALKLPGVALMTESRRYYPNRELAAHLLGYVGIENVGLGGIEGTDNALIRGSDGEMLVDIDAKNHRLDSRIEQAPTAGATLELTIDQYLQYITERELQAGVDAHHAKSGSAIVMDPQTGEVLALANYPTFNPNVYGQYSDEERRNRAIQDLYEPGSTFKIVTASAALQEGVWTTDEMVETSPGRIMIGKREVKDALGHDYGTISFEDVIVKSSNVGAIKIGLRVGAERLSAYIRRFGFGQALSDDLRGENPGIVWNPAKITDSALASMSMGYQVGVTPLQMAAAVSAIANGGTLYAPHVVRAWIRDNVRTVVAPKPLRQAITPETAATVTSIMEEVAKRGTGTKAQLDGYQIAGKTGTAAKLIDGRYSDTDYNASFVGFVPSRHAALTIVVVVDTPRGGTYFGGDVAAPIFKRIAEASLRQIGVPATLHPTPPVIMAQDTSTPAANHQAHIIPVVSAVGGQPSMPDVRGVSAREALRLLGAVGLSMRVEGTGVVVTQLPAPGEPFERGAWGLLRLSRAPVTGHAPGGGRP